MSHGGSLYLTIGKYFLPDGSSVEEKGLEPDYLIPIDPEKEKQLRIQRDMDGRIQPEEFEATFGSPYLPDPHWLKATELLDHHRSGE